MNTKSVKDLMITLGDYALVSAESTVVDALRVLKKAEFALEARRKVPPRAVLVVNDSQDIVGQLGHLEFLKALEPKYRLLGDLDTLSRAGVSSDVIGALTNNLRLWQGDLKDVCAQARNIKVAEVMRPITESIDENASLAEATHRMVMWQAMRVLVTREDEVVGVLRLADLVAEVAEHLDPQQGHGGSQQDSM